MLRLGGSNDWRSYARGLQDPRASHLSRRHTPSLGYIENCIDNREVIVAVIHVLRKSIHLGTRGCAAVALASSGQKPTRQRTPGNHGQTLIHTEGNHLALVLTIDQVVMILHSDKLVPVIFFGGIQRLRELPGRHAAGSQVAHLAGANEGIESVQSLLNGCLGIPTMDLIQVDVIHSQTTERVIASLQNMLAAEASAVGAGTHHPVDLGGQDDVVTRGHLIEVKPGDLFAQPSRVNIGGIKEIDSGIESYREVLARVFFVDMPSASALRPFRHLAAAIAHASQTKAGYCDSCLAKICKFHLSDPDAQHRPTSLT